MLGPHKDSTMMLSDVLVHAEVKAVHFPGKVRTFFFKSGLFLPTSNDGLKVTTWF